jgi:hypothetical protein
MTDEHQDVLTAFLASAAEYGDETFAAAVAAAAPRLQDVANGTFVALSPPDALAGMSVRRAQHRRYLDEGVLLARAAGWRIDPPRAAAG